MNMVNNTSGKLKPYKTKAYRFLVDIWNMITEVSSHNIRTARAWDSDFEIFHNFA